MNIDPGQMQSRGHASLDAVIGEAVRALRNRQRPDGYWVYDLEADATIPAEYIMLNHYLDEREDEIEANYRRPAAR